MGHDIENAYDREVAAFGDTAFMVLLSLTLSHSLFLSHTHTHTHTHAHARALSLDKRSGYHAFMVPTHGPIQLGDLIKFTMPQLTLGHR